MLYRPLRYALLNVIGKLGECNDAVLIAFVLKRIGKSLQSGNQMSSKDAVFSIRILIAVPSLFSRKERRSDFGLLIFLGI